MWMFKNVSDAVNGSEVDLNQHSILDDIRREWNCLVKFFRGFFRRC